jgi:type IV secretion system protein VirB1
MLALDLHPDFTSLSMQCAPTVHVHTMRALVKVESSFRQFAIAVVDGPQVRHPRSLKEAVATLEDLHRKGYNYSVGYAQVNKINFQKYKLTLQTAFDPCTNLRAGSKILESCFVSAGRKYKDEQTRLRAAFSCYYSGNFLRGFRPDRKGVPSYVDKVVTAAIGQSDGNTGPVASLRRVAIPRNTNLGQGWAQAVIAEAD